MKNKKNILAFVNLIAGVICCCYYFVNQKGNIHSNFFTIPSIMLNQISVLISSAVLIISGICGLSSRSRTAKIMLYGVSLCSCVISCILFPTAYILYFFAAIALITLLVSLIDTSAEKKLYFVYYSGDILMTFDTKRPTYKEVYERRYHKTPEITEKSSKSHKNKVHRAKPLKKKITGYAISPKAKNYRKNAKRKNKKR